jgi:hypothetical protein
MTCCLEYPDVSAFAMLWLVVSKLACAAFNPETPVPSILPIFKLNPKSFRQKYFLIG